MPWGARRLQAGYGEGRQTGVLEAGGGGASDAASESCLDGRPYCAWLFVVVVDYEQNMLRSLLRGKTSATEQYLNAGGMVLRRRIGVKSRCVRLDRTVLVLKELAAGRVLRVTGRKRSYDRTAM